jgi:hypothetical protein
MGGQEKFQIWGDTQKFLQTLNRLEFKKSEKIAAGGQIAEIHGFN